MSEPAGDEDVRGYFTIRLEGGPALAGNLAVAVRTSAQKAWAYSPDMRAALGSLAAALDSAEFTPVRAVEIRQRSPEEVRARLLSPSSPLPPELAQALADELAPLSADVLARIAASPDPHPERRSPGYCWRSWPPRHTDTCGCDRQEPAS